MIIVGEDRQLIDILMDFLPYTLPDQTTGFKEITPLIQEYYGLRGEGYNHNQVIGHMAKTYMPYHQNKRDEQ